MGVYGKLAIEVDIKSTGDAFHELMRDDPHHFSNIAPDKVHGCDLHEGEFGKAGSIIQWNYTCEGKKCFAKQKIEEIDEEKRLVKFKYIAGDLLEDFKNVIITMQVIPKGEIDAIMWTIEFEKFSDIGPYPNALMDLFIVITRDVEAHHLK